MGSLFLRTWGIHQLKTGSWSMPRNLTYSAVSIGCDSLRSASFSQDVEPSFHWQHSCQPMVVHFRYVLPSVQTKLWSVSFIAEGRHWWFTISSKKTSWLPLGSHCEYSNLVIMLAESSVWSPQQCRIVCQGLGCHWQVQLDCHPGLFFVQSSSS